MYCAELLSQLEATGAIALDSLSSFLLQRATAIQSKIKETEHHHWALRSYVPRTKDSSTVLLSSYAELYIV